MHLLVIWLRCELHRGSHHRCCDPAGRVDSRRQLEQRHQRRRLCRERQQRPFQREHQHPVPVRALVVPPLAQCHSERSEESCRLIATTRDPSLRLGFAQDDTETRGWVSPEPVEGPVRPWGGSYCGPCGLELVWPGPACRCFPAFPRHLHRARGAQSREATASARSHRSATIGASERPEPLAPAFLPGGGGEAEGECFRNHFCRRRIRWSLIA